MSERAIIRWLLKIGPWLTPVGTVYAIQRSFIKHFAFPDGVAWIAASVVEILGIGSIYLWMSCDDWNRRHRSDAKARAGLAQILVALYVATTITLIIVLDVVAGAERWALAILPLLSVVAYLALSIFSELEHMEGERKQAREERKQAVATGNASNCGNRGNYGEYLAEQAARNGDGLLTAEEIMARFNVPQRTAYNWREKYQRGTTT